MVLVRNFLSISKN